MHNQSSHRRRRRSATSRSRSRSSSSASDVAKASYQQLIELVERESALTDALSCRELADLVQLPHSGIRNQIVRLVVPANTTSSPACLQALRHAFASQSPGIPSGVHMLSVMRDQSLDALAAVAGCLALELPSCDPAEAAAVVSRVFPLHQKLQHLALTGRLECVLQLLAGSAQHCASLSYLGLDIRPGSQDSTPSDVDPVLHAIARHTSVRVLVLRCPSLLVNASSASWTAVLKMPRLQYLSLDTSAADIASVKLIFRLLAAREHPLRGLRFTRTVLTNLEVRRHVLASRHALPVLRHLWIFNEFSLTPEHQDAFDIFTFILLPEMLQLQDLRLCAPVQLSHVLQVLRAVPRPVRLRRLHLLGAVSNSVTDLEDLAEYVPVLRPSAIVSLGRVSTPFLTCILVHLPLLQELDLVNVQPDALPHIPPLLAGMLQLRDLALPDAMPADMLLHVLDTVLPQLHNLRSLMTPASVIIDTPAGQALAHLLSDLPRLVLLALAAEATSRHALHAAFAALPPARLQNIVIHRHQPAPVILPYPVIRASISTATIMKSGHPRTLPSKQPGYLVDPDSRDGVFPDLDKDVPPLFDLVANHILGTPDLARAAARANAAALLPPGLASDELRLRLVTCHTCRVWRRSEQCVWCLHQPSAWDNVLHQVPRCSLCTIRAPARRWKLQEG